MSLTGQEYAAPTSRFQYGLGLLLHELLHKQGIAGGFKHFEIDQALDAVHAPGVGFQTEVRASRIGQICF